MSLKIESEAKSLAPDIYQDTLDIHRIGVDVCKDIPVRDGIPVTIPELCKAITTDIFHSAGIQKHEAAECFKAIVGRINGTGVLAYSKLESLEDVEFIRQNLSRVMKLQANIKNIACPPASLMGCMIAAVAYRKLQPGNKKFFEENKDLIKVFGELNGIQWLPVAIQVWQKVKTSAFIIQLDPNNEKPVAKRRKFDGKRLWVVTTRMPEMNRYESTLRNTLCPAVQGSGPMVLKQEPDDNVLPSVEPNDIANEAITLSDDDEMEDNTITLRDYTRQMKTLAKRLSTPDRVIARRARKEIMKKPHEFGEQKVEEIGPPKEFFDSYTHLKDVWKTCLQNRVSIPNSLRVLIDHHCTPSQVFHLMELEKEHLAEAGMEVDG